MTACHLQITTHQPQIIVCHLQMIEHEPRITACELRLTTREPQVRSREVRLTTSQMHLGIIVPISQVIIRRFRIPICWLFILPRMIFLRIHLIEKTTTYVYT